MRVVVAAPGQFQTITVKPFHFSFIENILFNTGLAKFDRISTTRDVIIVSDLFGDPNDLTIYNKLLQVLQNNIQRLFILKLIF